MIAADSAPADRSPETGTAADVALEAPTLVMSRSSVLGHLRLVVRYHELLVALVRKELKVKYKGSSLGFLWSLLNPLLYLAVFYYVFEVVLEAGSPTSLSSCCQVSWRGTSSAPPCSRAPAPSSTTVRW